MRSGQAPVTRLLKPTHGKIVTDNQPSRLASTSKVLELDPDLIIVISRVVFGRNFTPGSMYMPGHTISIPGGSFTTPGTFGGGGSESLNASVEFIIYDYKANDIVVCGSVPASQKFLFAMTQSVWMSCFDKVATEIFQKAPFRRVSRK